MSQVERRPPEEIVTIEEVAEEEAPTHGPDPADPSPSTSPSPEEIPVDIPDGPPWPPLVDPARRRQVMPWAIAAGLALILGVGGVTASYGPWFRATTVTVGGEHRFSERRILRIAGVGPGTNLLHVDLARAERRLERNRWIADASVSRDLPHGLSVTVVERTGIAVVGGGSAVTLIAGDGTSLGRAGARTDVLPTISSGDGSTEPTAAVLRLGAGVVAALPRSLTPQVQGVDVGDDGSILLQMRSGVMVTYGDDRDLRAKGQDLEAVLRWASGHGSPVAWVDVSVPGSPAMWATSRTEGTPVTVH